MKHRISVEPDSIIVTIGHSGSGKTTFLKNHFEDYQVVSVDETTYNLLGHYDFSNDYHREVMQILTTIIDVRASVGLFTVVDALGSSPLLERVEKLAQKHDRPVYALIFPHLLDHEISYERLGWRYFYIDTISNQIEKINEISLPERYNYFVIGKQERDQYEFRFKEETNYELNPNYNWIVVPDLHGHYSILEKTAKNKSNDERILFLGDVNDRGPSSYLTFLWMKKLTEKNEAVWIKGNHDKKLYDYFQRWLNDENRIYSLKTSGNTDFPHYSMKVNTYGGGFKKTLYEFYMILSPSAMMKYAEEFIRTYDENPNVKEYAYLKREDTIHYFAHANITNNAIQGKSLSQNDKNTCINRALKFEHENKIKSLLKHKKYDNVKVHLGHDVVTAGDIDKKVYQVDDQVIEVLKHDQGLGKYDLEVLKDFMII